MNNKFDVFISYNRDDAADVQSIRDYLRDAGLKVWFDEDSINPGERWLARIQNGLLESRTCVVILKKSPDRYQQEEVDLAIRHDIENVGFKLIPVLLPGALDPGRLPPFVTSRAWIDLRKGLLNVRVLKELVRAIRDETIVPIHDAPRHPEISTELPTGYSADVDKIISLLIGESLYSRRDVCVRELVQNAVDACERRRQSLLGSTFEIALSVNQEEGYFEVDDNGEGMNPEILSESFSIIGKTIRDEPRIIERATSNKDRLFLIAKFGIGFISTYMLASRVLVSTKYEGCQQINLEITNISEPFAYHKNSQCDRDPERVGTTIRVYIDERYVSEGDKLDVLGAVKHYCRHIPYLAISSDKGPVHEASRWGTGEAEVVSVERVPHFFEMHLGITQGRSGFFASNGGFLVSSNPEAIMPKFMPTSICGEINLLPGVVDLNISRDEIIKNEKSEKVKLNISRSINLLLKKAVKARLLRVRDSIKNVLCLFLEESLKTQSAQASPARVSFLSGIVQRREAPPMNSAEAAELLLDVWEVEMQGARHLLRDVIAYIKKRKIDRIYYHESVIDFNSDYAEEILGLFKGHLRDKGVPVVSVGRRHISCTGSRTYWFEERVAIKAIADRYDFDLLPLTEPRREDIDKMLVGKDSLSPVIQRVVEDIEAASGKAICIGKLSSAPPAFRLAGRDYLNMESPSFADLDASSSRYSEEHLMAYILGLLQYELRF